MYRLLILLVVACLFATGCGNGREARETSKPQYENASRAQQEPTRQALNNAITWKNTWHDAAQAARDADRDILLLFTDPDRCPPCRMMKQQTWPDSEVVGFVNRTFVPLKIHTGRSTERSLGNEFKVMGIPTTVVCDTDKHVLARKSGFAPPALFLKFLQSAASLRRFQEAAERDPDDLHAILQLAEAYHGLDRMAEAVPLLEKVCTMDNENSNGKKVAALHLLGTVALANKDLGEAKDKFRQAARLDPKRESEYADDNALQLALLSAHANDLASAASALDQFVKDFPGSSLRPEAFLYLGQCYAGSGDKGAAEKALENLLKEYPGTPEAGYAQRMLRELQ